MSDNYNLMEKELKSNIISESETVSDSKPCDEKLIAGPKKSDTKLSNDLQPNSSIAVSKHTTVETKTSEIITSAMSHSTQGNFLCCFI